MMTSDTTAIGATLPLLFTFRHTLFGNGFAVEVKAENGRALCVHEDDGVWLYGVNPGGMAAFGETADEARAEFRSTFARVLNDLAAEARTFTAFHALVLDFFNESNEGYEPVWVDAVQMVRERDLSADGLVKVSADAPRSISVEIKVAFNAHDNAADLEPALAA